MDAPNDRERGKRKAIAGGDAAPSTSEPSVTLPLKTGTLLKCRWKDGTLHPAEIIERRQTPSGDPHDYEYYVHYTEFDRRLDQWVNLERLDLSSVDTDVFAEVSHHLTTKMMTRHQKWKMVNRHLFHHHQGHEGFDAASLQEHWALTKVKNIETIELGRYEIATWYFSPLPPEYKNSKKLYFCEFCLNILETKEQLQRHMRKCDLKYPPGNEIYRSGALSLFEVDGMKNKVYTTNLCILAKFFLDHKLMPCEVASFLFHILCKCDDRGCHMVAYFSKEKYSEESYNLSCILTLPPYQNKGYGKFLIAFSYELSKKEGVAGTPERPLSDLGWRSYQSYWTRVLLNALKEHKSENDISIQELSKMTAMKTDDILRTLQSLDLVQYKKGRQVICTDPKVLDHHLKAAGSRGLKVDVSKLIWPPHVDLSQLQPPGWG
ncbi:putative MYST-like histone acetyltransferase 1 [Phoenix dactylifera]|uniref:Histone acetyltransferase n=1 Tax=Phoenix dactylifera TaxID=42345 RepID=A0A8B7CYX0_PHODC|nr:putative MYST-like histone acetyltransferase 1 [Phoenix dactylifera]